MSVPYHRVGDFLRLERRAVAVETGETYREIGLRSFGNGVFHKEVVTGAELADKRVFYIEPGDLVVSNVFAWEGALAVATERERGLIGSHRFMTWKPTTTNIDAKYLLHYFTSEPGLRSLGAASPGSAGRNRTLGVRAFEALQIPVPSIDEQRAIANRLDALVHLADSSIASSELVTSKTSTLSNQLIDTSFDEVPLARLLTETSRFEPVLPDHKYRSAGVKWYAEGVFARDEKPSQEIKATSLNRLVPGEFIYNRLFAWKGSFALTPDQELFASNEFPTFAIDRSQVLPEYLLGWFSLPNVWDEVLRLSTGVTPTSRNRLKVAQLLDLRIPLPPLAFQKKVVETIRTLDRIRALNSNRERIARALPQAARNAEFARLMS